MSFFKCLLFLTVAVYLPLLICLVEYVEGDCTEGAIRYDPNNTYVIQMCVAEQWGYICASNVHPAIKQLTAAVACRQMGYLPSMPGDPFETSITTGTDETTWPLHFSWLRCSESSPPLNDQLLNCHWRGVLTTSICNPAKVITANCSNINHSCEARSVKLVNSTVMICHDSEWKTICGNFWTLSSAQVVCRQLGMNHKGAQVKKNTVSVPPTGDEDVRLDVHFFCTGNEESLYSCQSIAKLNHCTPTTLAGVSCGEWPSPPHNLKAVSLGGSVSLSWNYSTNDNSTDELSHYSVQCTSDVQSQSNVFTRDTVTTNSTVMSGLSYSTTYNCCVSAVMTNNIGESEWTCCNVTTKPMNYTQMINGTTTCVTSTVTAAQPSVLCSDVHHMQPVSTVTVLVAATDIISASATVGVTSWIGGLLVGSVSGAVLVIIVWVICALITRKRSITKLSHQVTSSSVVAKRPTAQPIDNCQYESSPANDGDYSYATNNAVMSQSHVYEAVAEQTANGDCNGVYLEAKYNKQQPAEGLYSLAERETYDKLRRN